jgi:hypothetical protein
LFSYGYNFLRFCGKLFNGLYYVYDRLTIYIKRRNGYEYIENLESQNPQPKTLLQSCKTYLSKQYNYIYYKIFGKRNNYNNHENNRVNLAEITITNNTESFTSSVNKNKKDYENELFNQQMDELSLNSSSIELNYIHKHEEHESQYHSNEYDPLIEPVNSELDSGLFDPSSCYNDLVKNKNITDNVFHNVNLNNDSFLNNDYFNTSNDTYLNKSTQLEPVHLIIKDKLDTIPENSVSFKVYEYTKDQFIEHVVEEQVIETEEHVIETEEHVIETEEHNNTNVRDLNKSILETIFEESEPIENNNHLNYLHYSYIKDDSSDELRKEILKNPYI